MAKLLEMVLLSVRSEVKTLGIKVMQQKNTCNAVLVCKSSTKLEVTGNPHRLVKLTLENLSYTTPQTQAVHVQLSL